MPLTLRPTGLSRDPNAPDWNVLDGGTQPRSQKTDRPNWAIYPHKAPTRTSVPSSVNSSLGRTPSEYKRTLSIFLFDTPSFSLSAEICARRCSMFGISSHFIRLG